MDIVERLREICSRVMSLFGSRRELRLVAASHVNEKLQSFLEPASITRLIIVRCEITTLTLHVGTFKNLVHLDLSSNKLQYVPYSICVLRNLENLDLSNNLLKLIQPLMCQFKKLKYLNVCNNQLEKLPSNLTGLSALEVLLVDENPLLSPPMDTCRQGVHAVFEAIAKREERSNCLANWKPYYTTNDPYRLKSLLDMCIDRIIDSEVDFMSAPSIPPTVKNYLNDAGTVVTNLPKLLKCSECKAYFTQSHLFENHTCLHKVKAQMKKKPVDVQVAPKTTQKPTTPKRVKQPTEPKVLHVPATVVKCNQCGKHFSHIDMITSHRCTL